MDIQPDFEVDITLVPGRTIYKGIRPTFTYLDDPKPGWLIFPIDFFDEDGKVIREGQPITGKVHATMMILDPALRDTIHRERLKVDTPFLWLDGVIFAEGVVTKLESSLTGDEA
jgi:hypothetical protein